MNKRDFLEELMKMGWGSKEIAELLSSLKRRVEEIERANKQEERERIEKNLRKILMDVGIPFNLLGRKYLLEGIIYCMENGKENTSMIAMYEYIAIKHGKTYKSVDRTMRYAIEKAFDKYNPKLEEIFGWTVHEVRGYPTNREFIKGIVSYLKTLKD